MKSNLILWMLFLSGFLWSNAQTTSLKYDIIVGGKTLGIVKATKTEKDAKIIYTSDSDTEVHILGTIKIKTRMTTIFENGILTESTYKYYKNDNLKEKATLTQTSNGYSFVHNDKTSTISEPIKCSTIMLYFYIPKEGEKVFEEVEGYFKTIKKEKIDNYLLIDPKSSHKDIYNYIDGNLYYNLVNNTLVDFEMVLKKD
tara:strand:- start:795 stop:1391 length:597 start_codon:yes stop_codon:yes gene_type:complete